MAFAEGDWVLGAACAKCWRDMPLFVDVNRGKGDKLPPVRGLFRFRCANCGVDNRVECDRLNRFQVNRARSSPAS